jgi:hypothetical protein
MGKNIRLRRHVLHIYFSKHSPKLIRPRRLIKRQKKSPAALNPGELHSPPKILSRLGQVFMFLWSKVEVAVENGNREPRVLVGEEARSTVGQSAL